MPFCGEFDIMFGNTSFRYLPTSSVDEYALPFCSESFQYDNGSSIYHGAKGVEYSSSRPCCFPSTSSVDEYALPVFPENFFADNCTSINKRPGILEAPSSNEERPLLPSEGFVDTHCHLDFLFDRMRYSGSFETFRRQHAFPKSFDGCVAVFCKPDTFAKELHWKRFLDDPVVYGAFGCHPHKAQLFTDRIEQNLSHALNHPKVRALGEIGLDYSNRNNCLKGKQFDAFRKQLRMAQHKNLNLVIHCREAHEDAIRIIKEEVPNDYRIHLHCFNDTWYWAEKWMQEFPNLLFGLTNVVTNPKALDVREVAKRMPLSRLLLETDAPYFIPRSGPHNRSVNSQKSSSSNPSMAINVAEAIASLKKVSVEEVMKATRKNTTKMYGI